MIWRMALAIAVAFPIGGVLWGPMTTRPAAACSLSPETFEEGVRRMEIIGLFDVVEIGGAANESPNVPPPSPTATPSPEPTSTSPSTPAGRTARADTMASPLANTETAVPAPTATTFPMPDLTGVRATLSPVAVYAGEAIGNVTVDAESRRGYERTLRERAAGYRRPPCDFGSPPMYAVGERYVVFVSSTAGARATYQRFAVVDDRVIVSLQLDGTVYRRYLPDFDARISEFEGVETATIIDQHVPLSTLARLVRSIRASDVAITPPSTGSAGLAAGRKR